MGGEIKEASLNLARKYRPQKFSEVVGQKVITKTLKNALKMNKLGNEIQALLFAGPRGSGKTSIARIVSKTLNCEKPQDGEPCDECSSCLEIKKGASLDVLEIDGASYRGIQEAKNIIEITKLVPTKNKYKVFIIDEVHMFSKDAFNALLKTLEEPPPRVFFIFATTELYRVPDTIQSRCLVFEFSPIPEESLFERLKEVCEYENIKAEESALRLISKSAGGSLRDALQLLEKTYYFSEGKINEENVREILGFLPDETNALLLEYISERKGGELMEYLDDLLKKHTEKEILNSFLYFLEDVLREMERNIVKRYSKNLTKEDITRFMQYIFDVQKIIYFIQDPRLLILHAFYRMIYLPRAIEVREILEKGDVFSDLHKKEVVRIEEKKEEEKKEESPVDLFLLEVRKINNLIYSILKDRGEWGENSLSVKVKEGIESELMEKENKRIEEILREIFGKEFEFKLIIETKEKEEFPEILRKFENEFSLSLFKEEEKG